MIVLLFEAANPAWIERAFSSKVPVAPHPALAIQITPLAIKVSTTMGILNAALRLA
jgi:hypothetical protein